jgi:hypothetical protein
LLVVMTNNLFLLPYWAPALRRVPIPLQALNQAYAGGEGARRNARRTERVARHLPCCDRQPSQEQSSLR